MFKILDSFIEETQRFADRVKPEDFIKFIYASTAVLVLTKVLNFCI